MKTTVETTELKTRRQSQNRSDQTPDLQAASALSQQQGRLGQQISSGAVMTAQRKKIERMNTAAGPVQLQSLEEDEELMQGKMAAQLQPEEDEELLQGTFETGAARKSFIDRG